MLSNYDPLKPLPGFFPVHVRPLHCYTDEVKGLLGKVFSMIGFQDIICAVSSVTALLCCAFICVNHCANVLLTLPEVLL